MTSHLTFPLTWEECSRQDACDKTVHLQEESSFLNTLPRGWLEELVADCEISKYCITLYDDQREYHNENGPALTWFDGSQEWYRHGLRHRENGPAIEESDGRREWWRNGKQHRVDGPAVEQADGSTAWMLEGKIHRTNGPAIIWGNGEEGWFIKGIRHPAPEIVQA